jgi:hypothetical protein
VTEHRSADREATTPIDESWRDPLARVVHHGGHADTVHRLVRGPVAAAWRALLDSPAGSGLFDRGLLEPVWRVPDAVTSDDTAATAPLLLGQARLPVVSAVFEWSHSMLQDASMHVLRVLEQLASDGMTLRDGGVANVQWRGAAPTFIDAGSVAADSGGGWAGYREFCMQGLYPLMLAHHLRIPCQPLVRGSVHGVPPETAARMLRGRARMQRSVFLHVHTHARLERRMGGRGVAVRRSLSEGGLAAEHVAAVARRLQRVVGSLDIPDGDARDSPWSRYRSEHAHAQADLPRKVEVAAACAASISGTVLDLGCNDGAIARALGERGACVVAVDADAGLVDRLYRELRVEGRTDVLPLVVDLLDPSHGRGPDGSARGSLAERVRPELVLCLGLLHHLVLDGGMPLERVMRMLASWRVPVLLEVADASDALVARMLRSRSAEDLHRYDRAEIVAAAERSFSVDPLESLPSGRDLWLLRPRGDQ